MVARQQLPLLPGEINGKKYMVALFKTTAVTNPDYKPNQNPDKN